MLKASVLQEKKTLLQESESIRMGAVSGSGCSRSIGAYAKHFEELQKANEIFFRAYPKRKNLKGFRGNGVLSAVCFCISRQGFFVLHDIRCRKSHVYRKKCFGGL